MNFLYPQALWGFLLLLIPLIIHLFNFKRYKTIYFSSLKFVRHVEEQSKSTRRLKHYLVLLSRLLAFSCLVLAFAQPYFGSNAGNSNGIGKLDFVYIDNSFSMQAIGPEGELLSEAKEKARELIENADADQQYIIATNLLNGQEERILNRSEALERIDKLDYSPLSKSIDAVCEWNGRLLNKLSNGSEIKNVRSFYLSDFQKKDVAKKIDEDRRFNYYPIQFISEKRSNVFIDSVWFTDPIQRIGATNELNVRVKNNSDVNLENIELEFRIGDMEKIVFVNAKANEETTSRITYKNRNTGAVKGKILIADNSVYFDDTYYISYDVDKNANVLVLDGEDAVPNIAILYGLEKYYNVTTKEVSQFTRGDFADKDLVVFNSINGFSTGLQTYVNELLQAGISVALFPGTSPNLSDWNVFLQKQGLSPFGSGVGSGTRIKSLNYADAFFQGVFEREKEVLNLPSVNKTFNASSSNGQGTSLITLQNGLSLLTYKKDVGNLFLFYSSLDESFGPFSKDALCSTMLLRMGELSKRKQPIQLMIGQEAQYPIYETIEADKPVRIRKEDFEFIPERSEVTGVNYISLNRVSGIDELKAGNYEIVTSERLGFISLNYDRSESLLKYLNTNNILELFLAEKHTVEVNEFGSSSNFSTRELDKPTSYWRFFIILTLIFVLTEMVLIRFLK